MIAWNLKKKKKKRNLSYTDNSIHEQQFQKNCWDLCSMIYLGGENVMNYQMHWRGDLVVDVDEFSPVMFLSLS